MSTKNQVKYFAWKILYVLIVYLENEKVLFLAPSRQVTEFSKLGKHGTQHSSPAMTLEFTEILKHISTAMLTFLR